MFFSLDSVRQVNFIMSGVEIAGDDDLLAILMQPITDFQQFIIKFQLIGHPGIFLAAIGEIDVIEVNILEL